MEMENRVEVETSPNVDRKRKNKKKESIVTEVLNDYCSSSTIHGIGYIGANDKNFAEKIWWIIVVIISIVSCGCLISRTWTKWKTSPVILSFEQEQTPVWKIPFPAVTVCPLNKVEQTVYNYTEMFRNKDDLEDEEYKKFWDVSLICNLEEYHTPFNGSFNITDKNAVHNILSVAPNVTDTFIDIRWQGKEQSDESKFFTEQLTQEGLCFSFNTFSQEDMYTDELDHEINYINHSMKIAGWRIEEGLIPDSSPSNDYPRRTAKDGYGSGLRIRMFHLPENNDYIILHNPAEIPRPSQQYFLVPINKQLVLTVKPELTTTSPYLRSMATSSRKCYFTYEKLLRFFKVYTQSNCQIECTVNVTQNICGCVPFYVPSGKETAICGYGKMNCIFEAEAKMLDFEMLQKDETMSNEVRESEPYKIFDKCNCLPSCTDLKFSAETSQTDLHAVSSVLASGLADSIEPEELEQLQTGALTLSQVDIFFKESQFVALHRSELYGQTDFLASCGGLLGLFMGFSFLSLIEIIYFATIRLWIKWRNKRNTS